MINQLRRVVARADCIVGIGDAGLLGVELAQEFFGGFYQLGIDAFQHIGGEVIYFHVGIQLLVFKCFAVLVKGSNLRNTEDDGRVNLGFPPNGGHGARNRCADHLSSSSVIWNY